MLRVVRRVSGLRGSLHFHNWDLLRTSQRGKCLPIRFLSAKSETWDFFGLNATAREREERRNALDETDAISPELLDITIGEAIGREDGRTLRVLLANAHKGGKVAPDVLKKVWIYSISTRSGIDLETGAMTLQHALGHTDSLVLAAEEHHCQDLLQGLILQCKWYQAAVVCEYMIRCGMTFGGDRELFFITSGLMKSAVGMVRATQLLTAVVEHQRDDVDGLFNYGKITRLSLSLHSEAHTTQQEGGIEEAPLRRLSEALLKQMKADEPWFSFTASKTFVALAVACKHYELAMEFIEESLEIGERAQRSGSPLEGKIGVLDMLRAYSQGAGRAQSDKKAFRQNDASRTPCPVSERLLDLSVEFLHNNRPAAASILGSPLKGVEFLKLYWVLAHRVEQASLTSRPSSHSAQVYSPSSSSGTGTTGGLAAESVSDSFPRMEYIEDAREQGSGGVDESIANLHCDPAVVSSYGQLVAFMADESAKQMSSSPAPGYHRRTFRYLCDALGLRHQVVELLSEKSGGVGDTYGVKVWKQDIRRMGIKPPSLSEILLRDAQKGPAMRRFTPPPRHWDFIASALVNHASPDGVKRLVGMTTLAMHQAYPRAEWGLLFLGVLGEAGSPIDATCTGLLRNVLEMGAKQNDIYGVLEVLYANEESAYQHPREGHSSKDLDLEQRADEELLRRRRFHDAFDDLDEARAAERTLDVHFDFDSERGGEKTTAWNTPLSMPFSLPVPTGATTASEAKIRGPLRKRDWHQACRAAYHSRLSDVPSSSFKEAFTEVMRLMREAQVDMDESSMRTLLRFLVYTESDTDLSGRILKRMYLDKSTTISHIECVSLTSLMLRRLPDMQLGADRIQLSRPLYRSSNYLFVYPEALSYIFDQVVKNADSLGEDFLQRFESAWQRTHEREGRHHLWQLLVESLGEPGDTSGPRGELLRANHDTRMCIFMLAIYSGYLTGAFGVYRGGSNGGGGVDERQGDKSDFRRAYTLLYSAETLMAEADELEADQQRYEVYRDDN